MGPGSHPCARGTCVNNYCVCDDKNCKDLYCNCPTNGPRPTPTPGPIKPLPPSGGGGGLCVGPGSHPCAQGTCVNNYCVCNDKNCKDPYCNC